MDTTAVALTDPTGEYDADISQSIEDPPPASHPAVHPSPNPSQTESERKVSEEASLPTNSVEDDVFGPAAIGQPRQIRKRARKSRPLSDAQSRSSPRCIESF